MSQSNLCHIVGAGAIGQYIAYELASYFPVCLHSRHSTLRNIEFEDIHNQSHSLELVDDDNNDNNDIQLLIICTKSFEALAAFKQYQPRLSATSIVLCLFNGLGPQFEIEKAHPNTWLATTTVGVRKLATNKIKHTGLGETLIGKTSDQPLISPLFSQNIIACLPWQHSTNILEKLYLKLAINSLINPLTAIYNCKNGALLNNAKALRTMQGLASEIEELCKSLTIHLHATDIFKISCEVAQKTAENYSSMQQDILNKRQSEIELINGYWQQLGMLTGIITIYNSKMIEQVKALSNY